MSAKIRLSFKLKAAIINSINFFYLIKVLKDKPLKPPTLAQFNIINKNLSANNVAVEQISEFRMFKKSIVNLFKNANFCLILISYGN